MGLEEKWSPIKWVSTFQIFTEWMNEWMNESVHDIDIYIVTERDC